MATTAEVLARVPLFSMLPKKEVAKLASDAQERTFPAGTVMTSEDQAGVSFGVIVDGRAAVSVHERVARALGPGDYFGEMALIDRSYRSCSDGEPDHDSAVLDLSPAPAGKALVQRGWLGVPVRDADRLTARRAHTCRADFAICCCHFRFTGAQAGRIGRVIHRDGVRYR